MNMTIGDFFSDGSENMDDILAGFENFDDVYGGEEPGLTEHLRFQEQREMEIEKRKK